MAKRTAWRSLFSMPLAKADPRLARLLARQAADNRSSVNLIASECYAPEASLAAQASVLVNKNASGYPGSRVFAGTQVVDEIERLAIERAKRLFGAEAANVQSLSSTVANLAVLRVLLKHGGRILAFDRAAGGHQSHGAKNHISGQDYEVQTFGVDEPTGAIDYGQAGRLAHQFKPEVIIAGSSNYPRAIDFERLRAIADESGARLFADIAHVAGLAVAGLHQNPAPYADAATTSTHKTLCGPRTGGLVLSKATYAAAIDAALSPGLQDAPGAHIIAGRAVLFDLVARPPFRSLMRAVVESARTLAGALLGRGIPLYTGGTETHMIVVDLRDKAWSGRDVVDHLERHGLLANATRLPERPGGRGPLALRIGSLAMSIRGLNAAGFRAVGNALADLLSRDPSSPVDAALAKRMAALGRAHPVPARRGG